MSVFQDAGSAMILAAEGNVELARLIQSGWKTFTASFKSWLASMPATLPPTEPAPR